MEPKAIVDRMLEQDYFSRWLGLEVVSVGKGACTLEYTVRRDMLNGHGQVHGGVLFSASDSAFAFASNSQGRIAVVLDVSITFTKAAKEGERLRVTAQEQHLGNKVGVYDIRTENEQGQLVALF
ncbi:MAG: hotdog fold thioesterase [Chitinophagaceae bacterium]